MNRRGLARIGAVFGALVLSSGTVHAGMLNSIFNSVGGLPIPVPGVGGIRVSSGQQRQSMQSMPQTARSMAGQTYNEGIRLSDMNRLQEARMKFEQAIQIDPSFEMGWSTLVGACMVSGQLEEGIAVGNQFLANFPHSSRRKETMLIMQKLNEQIAKKNEIWQKVGPDGADSYFGLATEGKNFYGWNLDLMPLKVFISDGHGVRGYRPNDSVILNNSFAEWSQATEQHMTFTKVDNLADANIEVIWIDDPKDFPQNKGLEAGMAVPRLNSDGFIVQSKLYILTKDRHDSKPTDDLVLHEVCLHEIGHTLGLLGHSDNPGDIMFFSASGQKVQEPHLSQRDVNTLAKLYSTVLKSRSTAAISRHEQFNAPYSAPPPAEAGVPQPYSIGKTFVSNTEAIAYLEKAVAAAPNDLALLDDLGTAYDNYGMELANKNEMRKAEQYFNLALAIHRNSQDQNKLRSTVGNLMQLLRFEKRDADANQLEQNCKQMLARYPGN
jgi:tetratricopeptide (TPR) repeat protein